MTSLLGLVARNVIQEQSLDQNVAEAVLTDLAGEMQFERQTLKMSVGAIVARPRGGIAEPARLANMLARLVDVPRAELAFARSPWYLTTRIRHQAVRQNREQNRRST